MTDATPAAKQSNLAFSKQEQHWLNHLKRCQESGLSLAAYARSHGIKDAIFLPVA